MEDAHYGYISFTYYKQYGANFSADLETFMCLLFLRIHYICSYKTVTSLRWYETPKITIRILLIMMADLETFMCLLFLRIHYICSYKTVTSLRWYETSKITIRILLITMADLETFMCLIFLRIHYICSYKTVTSLRWYETPKITIRILLITMLDEIKCCLLSILKRSDVFQIVTFILQQHLSI